MREGGERGRKSRRFNWSHSQVNRREPGREGWALEEVLRHVVVDVTFRAAWKGQHADLEEVRVKLV